MITIHDVAIARGIQENEDGCFSGDDYNRLGLPFLGGCISCGATIAPYNAAPNQHGYLSCATEECAASPFDSVEAFEQWAKETA